MKTSHKLTPDLRKAEQEIDNYYKSNPLLKLPFATAAWALLGFAEESMLKAHGDGTGSQYEAYNRLIKPHKSTKGILVRRLVMSMHTLMTTQIRLNLRN